MIIMKQLRILMLFITTITLFSCSSGSEEGSGTTGDGYTSLTLSSTKTTISAGESVTFVAKANNVSNVSTQAKFYVNGTLQTGNIIQMNTAGTLDVYSTSVNSSMPKEHKAVMKTDVAEHFISKFTQENDIILDCFFGYGTTGLVAKEMNRRYIGIEKEKSYFDMSVQRCGL